MPIHSGQDKDGQFYQWGKTGKKYYYDPNDKSSKQRALNKAKKQQTAIYSSGWKGDAMKLIRIKKKDSFDLGPAKKISAELQKLITIARDDNKMFALTEEDKKVAKDYVKTIYSQIDQLKEKIKFWENSIGKK